MTTTGKYKRRLAETCSPLIQYPSLVRAFVFFPPLTFGVATNNVHSKRCSKSSETLLHTSFSWSKRSAEWNICHKCWRQACLLYVNKQLWLLSTKYPRGHGLYRLRTRLFTVIYRSRQGTGRTGRLEIFQHIPRAAIRGSQDCIASPGRRSDPEVASKVSHRR